MPHNNRVSASAALRTNDMWSRTIGHDPYAADSEKVKQQEDNSDQAASLMLLAKMSNLSGVESRGGCKKCGMLGHMTFQCRNASGPVVENNDESSSSSSSSDEDERPARPAAPASQSLPQVSKKESSGRKRSHSDSDSDSDRSERKSSKKHKKSKDSSDKKSKKEKKEKKHKSDKDKKHKKEKKSKKSSRSSP